ncbi:MAG: hypothetical protein A2Y12_00505 [Planctomycetes bacterium GWF2_42_9]|nr:MAG: hypothetical protein A2Y12_00505 [Planctomycetes bacterium GWF2_42_9]
MDLKQYRIFIATYPFAETGKKPLSILQECGAELVFNPFNRRLKTGEVNDLIKDVDAVIAGTEPYNEETLKNCERLKLISRVGIGLDSVDLAYCRDNNIGVAYTPDAPSDGVAELAVGNMLNLVRHIHESDRSVREGAWNRLMGYLIREVKIGVIGVGRIGSRVINLLQTFQPNILAYDTDENVRKTQYPNTTWTDLETILKESDIITLHIPLNEKNHHFINREKIARMKTGAMLINTARGPIVDETALYDALVQKHLGGAAVDVFAKEPYDGPLVKLDNVVLTAHIAASANLSRYLMELGAAENSIAVLSGNVPSYDAIKDTFGAQS